MSTAGVEVYSDDGKLLAGVTSRLARITGRTTSVAGVAGSAVIDGVGRPFFVARDISSDSLFTNTSSPSITLSGMTVSWTAATRRFVISYGVS